MLQQLTSIFILFQLLFVLSHYFDHLVVVVEGIPLQQQKTLTCLFPPPKPPYPPECWTTSSTTTTPTPTTTSNTTNITTKQQQPCTYNGSVMYQLALFNHPIGVDFSNCQIPPGWAIKKANYSILAAYCNKNFALNDLYISLDLNHYIFDLKLNLPSPFCSDFEVYSFAIDTGNLWWFVDYVNNKNYLSLLPKNDISFFVSNQQLDLEIVRVDLPIQFFEPQLLVNPWSTNKPFSFSLTTQPSLIGLNLNFTCSIRYQQYVADGILFINEAQTQCNFPPTLEHFDLEMGSTFRAKVSLQPVCVPPLNVIMTENVYPIFNQPSVTSINPPSGPPSASITISGKGFFKSGSVQIRDTIGHQWDADNVDFDDLLFTFPNLGIASTKLCLQVTLNIVDFVPEGCNDLNSFNYVDDNQNNSF